MGRTRRRGKAERVRDVLLGLVDAYLTSGKPIGSNTLRDIQFADLSSATIRNYFAQLEQEGYLTQLHSSGGRIPSAKAYREYAEAHRDYRQVGQVEAEQLSVLRAEGSKEVTAYLEGAAQLLSDLTHTAVFLSAPRFDHDLIVQIKLVSLDTARCLAVMMTDFGVVRTEVLRLSAELPASKLKEIEQYFQWRLNGGPEPTGLTEDEQGYAQDLYNEAVLRYVVGYSHFSDEEVYRLGFSQLLDYADYADIAVLAKSLALFENLSSMRLLLRDCCASGELKCWIGEELSPYAPTGNNTAVIAIPYRIGGHAVGAIGVLGPQRLPYRELFGILRTVSDHVSNWLTATVGKKQLSYRQPRAAVLQLPAEEKAMLEDKRKKKD